MRFIGDVHGKIDRYLKQVEGCESSVQVGDMGIGFVPVPVLDKKHRFIRGNHDDPSMARVHPNCIRDGTIEDKIMYIGGAWSIDRQWRVAGHDWWPDEELSDAEFDYVIEKAKKYQPKILVTHDCPMFVPEQMFYKDPVKTRTQMALEEIWEAVRPDIWIFGHWHIDADLDIGGTRFICLGELSYVDIDV